MNNYSLNRIAPGKITARGWIREQLLRSKNGLGGHLPELEPGMIDYPYRGIKFDNIWNSNINAGWGAEISGNYWKGLILLAFALDDEELKTKADNWVSDVLKTQQEDGYLGAYKKGDNYADDYNAWGTNCGMTALSLYYEATGKKEVLDAIYRCMLWFCENWSGDNKTTYSGKSIIETMIWCYHYTGDERLVKFSEDYIDFLERNDVFGITLNQNDGDKIVYNSSHGAGYGNLIKHNAITYTANGNKKHLKDSLNLANKAINKIMQRTGGLTCYAEYIAPISPIVETEYCAFSFFQDSLSYLSAITGDPSFANHIERIVFNGAQGSRKKDEKAIAYMSSPNQIRATENSGFQIDTQVYAPCYPTSCCPVTSVWVIPNFVRNMILSDNNDNLFFSLYGPCEANIGDFKLIEDTAYPFRDSINITVANAPEKATSLHFRIPEWCKNARISVNDEVIVNSPISNSYYEINRVWKSGDTITLIFPMEVSLSRVDDSDGSQKFPLAIEYGPLLFALPIAEDWKIIKGNPHTPLPEGWHWYNVEPVVPESNYNATEIMGYKKHLISWNVAIDEKLDVDKIQVELNNDGGYVWEVPQIRLKLPAYKALYAYPPYPHHTPEVYDAPIAVQNALEIELVPFGCTNLRISYFPRADV